MLLKLRAKKFSSIRLASVFKINIKSSSKDSRHQFIRNSQRMLMSLVWQSRLQSPFLSTSHSWRSEPYINGVKIFASAVSISGWLAMTNSSIKISRKNTGRNYGLPGLFWRRASHHCQYYYILLCPTPYSSPRSSEDPSRFP